MIENFFVYIREYIKNEIEYMIPGGDYFFLNINFKKFLYYAKLNKIIITRKVKQGCSRIIILLV